MKLFYIDVPQPVISALEELLPDYKFAPKEQADIVVNAPVALPARIQELTNLITTPKQIRIYDIIFDISSRTANNISLTEKEMQIILYLYNNEVATKDELLKNIWGYAKDATTKTIETHIYRLRQKLLDNLNIDLVKTVQGAYKIECLL